MTFTEKLSYLIKDQHINRKILSEKSGIPYSTIDNWFKRSYENLGLATFIKLCDFFGVTMDSMAYDDKEIEYRVNEKSDFNKRLTRAYFEHPEQQPSVRKLLDLPDQEEERGKMEA